MEERKNYKCTQENFSGDRYAHYLGCQVGFSGVYICQNLSNSVIKTVNFIKHQLYLNKVVKKKKSKSLLCVKPSIQESLKVLK